MTVIEPDNNWPASVEEAEKQMQELTARWEEVDDHGDK